VVKCTGGKRKEKVERLADRGQVSEKGERRKERLEVRVRGKTLASNH
jgi:hypothetical protein